MDKNFPGEENLQMYLEGIQRDKNVVHDHTGGAEGQQTEDPCRAEQWEQHNGGSGRFPIQPMKRSG